MSNVTKLYHEILLSERDSVITCLKSCVNNYRMVIDNWDDLPPKAQGALESCIEGCNLLIQRLEVK